MWTPSTKLTLTITKATLTGAGEIRPHKLLFKAIHFLFMGRVGDLTLILITGILVTTIHTLGITSDGALTIHGVGTVGTAGVGVTIVHFSRLSIPILAMLSIMVIPSFTAGDIGMGMHLIIATGIGMTDAMNAAQYATTEEFIVLAIVAKRAVAANAARS